MRTKKKPHTSLGFFTLLLVGFIAIVAFIQLNSGFVTPIKSKAAQFGISDYACKSTDPEAVLVNALNIPGTLNPGQNADVSITIANCSKETWFRSQNYKLGSDNPQDNQNWGIGRVEFPFDLPPNKQMTVSFKIKAPTTAGAYPFQWGVVQEGRRWLSPSLPPGIIMVGKVVDCAGAASVVDTANDAQPIIQACINQATVGDILTFPPGRYLIKSQINVPKTLSLVTKGLENKQNVYCVASPEIKCAEFFADASYPQDPQPEKSSIIRVQSNTATTVERVGIKNLTFNGDRGNRQKAACIKANICVNASLMMNKGVVYGNAFILSVSWTSMETRGADTTFAYNFVANNGTKGYRTLKPNEPLPMTWSDGFSIINVNNVTVMNNIFHENTDVDLILWGTKNARVHFNRIEHFEKSQESFAAFALESETALYPAFADFSGSIISYNTIKCNKLCGIGMNLGTQNFRPQFQPIYGARIINNNIDGAIQGINLEGGGTASSPISMANNTVTNSGGYNTGCGFNTSALNVSPNSHVYFEDGKVPARTNFAWSTVNYTTTPTCKLPSCLYAAQYCKP